MSSPTKYPEAPEPRYNADTDTYHVDFDPHTTPDIITVVILAVADIQDISPTRLPPLCEQVNVDALDQTLHLQQETGVEIETVSFPVGNCDVTIEDGGNVSIDCPPELRTQNK